MLKRIHVMGLFTLILGVGLTQAQPYVSKYFGYPARTSDSATIPTGGGSTVDADSDTVADDLRFPVAVTTALGANSYVVVSVNVEGPLDQPTQGTLSVNFGGTAMTGKVGGQADSTGGNSVHVNLFWLPVSSLAVGTYNVDVINGWPTGTKGPSVTVWLVADAVGVSDKAWNGYRDDVDNPLNPGGVGDGGKAGYVGFNLPTDTNLLPLAPKVILVPCTVAPGPSDDSDLSSANQNDLALTLYFSGAAPGTSAYNTYIYKDSLMGAEGTFSGATPIWTGNIKRNPMTSATDYLSQFNIRENSSMFCTTAGYLGTDARVGGLFKAGWYRAGIATLAFAGSMANPNPANGDSRYFNLVELSWTNPTIPTGIFEYANPNDAPDPNYPYYRAADPNFPGAIVYDLKLGTDNPPTTTRFSNVATTWTANASLPISVYPGTYYWQVVIKSASDYSKMIAGPVWTFTKLDGIPPQIIPIFAAPIYYHEENSSAYTWVDALPADPNFATVQLCVTGTDPEDPFDTRTYLWEHIADSGPDAGTMTITPNNTACGPIVKLKVTTIDDPYKFKVTLSDGVDPVSRIFSIQVAANSCDAAKRVPGYVAYKGDLDSDCKVDLADLTKFAQDWLKCNSLDCP